MTVKNNNTKQPRSSNRHLGKAPSRSHRSGFASASIQLVQQLDTFADPEITTVEAVMLHRAGRFQLFRKAYAKTVGPAPEMVAGTPEARSRCSSAQELGISSALWN